VALTTRLDRPEGRCQIDVYRAEGDVGRGMRSRWGNRISPLVRRLGSEDPERRARDQMALEIEGVVDGGVHAENRLTEQDDLSRYILRSLRR
jgi:hypothetical protein